MIIEIQIKKKRPVLWSVAGGRWCVERGIPAGLVISHVEDNGRKTVSYPTIPKWYFKPLWPWVVYKSVQSVRDLVKAFKDVPYKPVR